MSKGQEGFDRKLEASGISRSHYYEIKQALRAGLAEQIFREKGKDFRSSPERNRSKGVRQGYWDYSILIDRRPNSVQNCKYVRQGRVVLGFVGIGHARIEFGNCDGKYLSGCRLIEELLSIVCVSTKRTADG